jgi:non-homologous end joining protein Ku
MPSRSSGGEPFVQDAVLCAYGIVGGDRPDRSEITKGYEYEKGKYITIEQEVLQKIKLESTSSFTF